MANIIKHETNIPEVYIYIDSISDHSDTLYDVHGWICSTKYNIEDILIDKKSVSPIFTPRQDVTRYYNPTDLNPGINFYLKKSNAFDSIQLKVKGKKELLDIGSMAKWIAYHSGFKSEEKGLIVVDDFYSDPDFIREWAINEISFSPSSYHKGERATDRFSIIGMKEKLEKIIGKPIYNWNDDSYANGIFQFCTADQPIVYHVDNQNYAGMVFLSPDAPANSGTAFYRSKVTGDYSFDNEKRMTERYVNAFKGSNAEMNFYDGSHFEKIDEIGNKYNRLVLFDAKNIHAATQYFGDKKENARLFHMFFFDI
jgi:hypothetical protein